MKYRARRFPTRYPIDVRRGRSLGRCIMENISFSGAGLLTDEPVNVDEVIVLEAPQGPIRANVKWAGSGKVGVAFEAELPAFVLDQFRYAVRSLGPGAYQNRNLTELR